MLQQEKAEDYVLATGENHTIREFAELSFKELGMEIEWQGSGINEIGLDSKSGKKIIGIDRKYYRPTEVNELLGDASIAKVKLGWKPKTSFEDLIKIMVTADFKKVQKRGY